MNFIRASRDQNCAKFLQEVPCMNCRKYFCMDPLKGVQKFIHTSPVLRGVGM